MTSLYWSMTSAEASASEYEYPVRDQFFREANALLEHLYLLLVSGPFRFTIHNRSPEKAIWLLHVDAQDTLREILKRMFPPCEMDKPVLERVSSCFLMHCSH